MKLKIRPAESISIGILGLWQGFDRGLPPDKSCVQVVGIPLIEFHLVFFLLYIVVSPKNIIINVFLYIISKYPQYICTNFDENMHKLLVVEKQLKNGKILIYYFTAQFSDKKKQ